VQQGQVLGTVGNADLIHRTCISKFGPRVVLSIHSVAEAQRRWSVRVGASAMDLAAADTPAASWAAILGHARQKNACQNDAGHRAAAQSVVAQSAFSQGAAT
jgi:hypothetical protein